ncbi:hypothetical protein [Anaerosinus sp.]|uniref:hypothetical protein n=1 Tax=Selenobaculum sp. TaxID=3074374 RepID=UPI003AB6D2E1
MTPDQVVEKLKEYGLETTRRTVLSYEKAGLIQKPIVETGKYKDYSAAVVGEFIAAWIFRHGEYGIKQEKIAEIRRDALEKIYYFQNVVKCDFLNLIKDGISLKELASKRGSYFRVGDQFQLKWLNIYFFVLANDDTDNSTIRKMIEFKTWNYMSGLSVEIDYSIDNDSIERNGKPRIDLHVKGIKIKIIVSDKDGEYWSPQDIADLYDVSYATPNMCAGYQDCCSFSYVDPETYFINNPKI